MVIRTNTWVDLVVTRTRPAIMVRYFIAILHIELDEFLRFVLVANAVSISDEASLHLP